MIPNIFIQNWSNHVKWQTPAQIEQDLIISFINPPSRYSEDIDFVQKNPDPIGKTIDASRDLLRPWLVNPVWKITERSAKLIYIVLLSRK